MKRRHPKARLAGLLLGLLLAAPALAADTDGDGIEDASDNCLLLPNAPPLDCDTDQDGYGNACDGDFNQDGVVATMDAMGPGSFREAFLTGQDIGNGTDMSCDGFVNAHDHYVYFRGPIYNGILGPSGLACAGTVPCP